MLRDPHIEVLRRGTELVAMTPEVRRFFFEPAPLIITKANVMARVHRRGHMDYVGVKTYRPDGSVKGEVRFVGLFTSQAYVRPPAEIPLLRHKVDGVIAASGYPPASHDGKALLNILNTFPRDELFQIGVEQLQEWCEGILDLEFRPRVRVFARVDSYDRFVSVLLYAPRDRYNTKVRVRIGDLLAADLQRPHRRPSIPTSPKARWCGCSSSSAATRARRRTWRSASWSAASRRSFSPGRIGWPMPSPAPATGPRRCSPSTATPSRLDTRRPFRRSVRSRTSSASSAWGQTSRS